MTKERFQKIAKHYGEAAEFPVSGKGPGCDRKFFTKELRRANTLVIVLSCAEGRYTQ